MSPLSVWVGFLVLSAAEAAPVATPVDSRIYDQQVAPLLVRYCFDCHGEGNSRGDVALDGQGHPSAQAFRTDRQLWQRVADNLRNDLMPPAGKPRPTAAERTTLLGWIQRDVHGVDCRKPDPGRVTIRRLNRLEYRHSVQDLFGIGFDPAEDFPPDDTGYGFDTIGDVLSMSPALMEKYFNAADEIVRQVVATRAEVPRYVMGPADLPVVEEPVPNLALRQGRVSVDHAGTYQVDIRVGLNSFTPWAGRVGIEISVDGRRQVRRSYTTGNRAYRYRLRLPLAAGSHLVGVRVDLRESRPPKGRSVSVTPEEIALRGPLGAGITRYPEPHARLFFRGPPPPDPAGRRHYAREILQRVAERAFRRPVDEPTLERLTELATSGEREATFAAGISQALRAVLVSPRFLFRAEGQPRPDDPTALHPLDEAALASRLSYFLWSSLPDDELRARAAAGDLRAGLRAQVARMVADPRAQRFVSAFVGQAFQTREVEASPINTRKLGNALRRAIRDETELLFLHIVREDRDPSELLTADYTFVNGPLAELYGLPGVEGSQMRKVALPADGPRGGILTHASFLVVTSNPDRTSPVKRGLYVLDNLLGAPPPPPPPNIPSLEDAARNAGRPLDMREQLELHRSKSACATCHARMDPIGLALEGFDNVGKAKEGQAFADLRGLRASLVSRKEQFYRTLTRRLFTYALGRGPEPQDDCTIDAIVRQLGSGGGKFSTLLYALVESPAFQLRRGETTR